MAAIVALGAGPLQALAQAGAGTVTGIVSSSDGAPLAGATVTLGSSTRSTTSTDAKGSYTFANVVPGEYALTVSKPGFNSSVQEGIIVLAGSTITNNVLLAAQSFSSLQTIANVSTNAPGRAQINTSTAATSTISSQVFQDQGQVQVTKVLNETPGVVTNITSIGNGGNGASEGSQQTIQIRGGLPYETETLIDGHPVSVGESGSFSQTFLNPALLQDVEIVKGPGSMPTEINYAIGGTVNYRTLEPTSTPHESVEAGIDGYGGISTALKATGSTLHHFLDYAFAYATDGTPGPLKNYPIAGSALPLVYGSAPWTLNGQQLATFPYGVGAPPPAAAVYGGTISQLQFQEPLYVCCAKANSDFDSRGELAKVRLNFSPSTALTMSYLGGQGQYNLQGADLQSSAPLGIAGSGWNVFTPPTGYTGSVAPGTAIPFDLVAEEANYREYSVQNLFQGEFRTALGATTLLARYYAGATTNYQIQDGPEGINAPFTFSGQTWGGVPLCPTGTTFDGNALCDEPGGGTENPVMTYFNGQQVTFGTQDVVNETLDQDHLHGESIELDRTIGENDYELSFDQSHHDSYEYVNSPQAGFIGFTLPQGSSQDFTTVRALGRFAVARHLTANLSYYVIRYASRYSSDGGTTWANASHVYNTPRFALSWRPNQNTAWRFSTGGSIAPPFIALLSSPGSQPQPDVLGAPTAWLENQNNGQISPETAFGYDLGVDQRIHGSMSFSGDIYETTLHNLFLPETYQDGTYTGPAGSVDAGVTLPLFISLTANLGVARYDGLEFSLRNAPLVGLGFNVQGALTRAYTYNLPAGFYDTSAGPYTTNLGITPNVNFQPTGLGYNSLEGGRVPYSMGYGELNYRTRSGRYIQLGVTYYGPNNTYNEPAFAVVSGAIRVPAGPGTTLQLSANNLLGAYSNKWFSYFGGVPVNLATAGNATTGYLGATPGYNVGPTTIRFSIRHNF